MNILILAPHPDDEVIGCSTILRKAKLNQDSVNIVYFFDITKERLRELISLSVDEKFRFYIFEEDKKKLEYLFDEADQVYVPSEKDNHPAHKFVNQFAYKFNPIDYGYELAFYTIDKNIPFSVLSPDEIEYKKQLLSYYSSQKRLWEHDEKYILFEGFRKRDYQLFASISFQFEGFHKWEDCNNEQTYLKNLHRHIFWVWVEIEQAHNDRDVEYIEAKNRIQEFWSEEIGDNKLVGSCEDIAEDILYLVKMRYPNRKIKITVKEDNENGCRLEQ